MVYTVAGGEAVGGMQLPVLEFTKRKVTPQFKLTRIFQK